MTEIAGSSQDPIDLGPSTVVNTSESDVNQSPTDEKFVPQSKVNEIVGRAKRESVESYKKSLESNNNQSTDYSFSNNSHNTIENMDELIRHHIFDYAEKAKKEAQDKFLRQEADKIATNFVQKLSAGKEKYSDFEDVVGSIPIAEYPGLVELMANRDDTADLMYHLAQNPVALESIHSMASNSQKRNLAIKEIEKVVNSIKQNEAAKNAKIPNPPLSQLRPSNIGADNGRPSISDLRARYRV